MRSGVTRSYLAAVAIAFARARYISRSSGGSAVRSAAYNAREAITAERTGELFYFRHRDAPEHHAVLLPIGAPARFAQAGELWNAAEAAERRRDAQVAREIVLALPANAEVTTEDRVAIARAFAEAHFVSKGNAGFEMNPPASAWPRSTSSSTPDRIPAVAGVTFTRPGDLWQLGRCRLLCGDARAPADLPW